MQEQGISSYDYVYGNIHVRYYIIIVTSIPFNIPLSSSAGMMWASLIGLSIPQRLLTSDFYFHVCCFSDI